MTGSAEMTAPQILGVFSLYIWTEGLRLTLLGSGSMKGLLQKTLPCGLCLFPLPADAPALNEPTVYRMRQPTWPPEKWAEGTPDDIVEMPTGAYRLSIKTTPILLQTSSKRGCTGCAAILECLANYIQQKGILIDQSCLQNELRLVWSLKGAPEEARFTFLINFATVGNGIERVAMVIGYTRRMYRASLFIHPAAGRLQLDTAQGYTGSTASLKQLKKSLRECVSSHPECKLRISPLPHRVLEISKDIRSRISVRLVQGIRAAAHYACLSHRWGPSTSRFRTLRSNLSSQVKSIPWGALPKTFQDAISVTLFLGLKYLWIDSLCIIQDDADDWKAQAAEMCNIYQGAYVTIAATITNDSIDGLFKAMKPGVIIPPLNPMYQKLFIRPLPPILPNLDGGDHNGEFPLLGRGWVFQERILSPRFAQFANEISLECSNWSPRRSSIDKQAHLGALGSTKLTVILSHWHALVRYFTNMNLTYHSDSLPALAGIARQYGTTHARDLGRYVAGLWENTLPQNLIWSISSHNGKGVKRPEKYSAPTWSWASVEYEVEVLCYSRTGDELLIISSEVALAGPDEYGPVTSGELKVKGYLAIGTWKWCSTGKNERPWLGFQAQTRTQDPTQCCKAVSDSDFHRIHIDYDLSIPGGRGHVAEDESLYCLKTGFIGDGMHLCLIFRAVDWEKGIFERVGLLRETKREYVESWFRPEVAQEVITII